MYIKSRRKTLAHISLALIPALLLAFLLVTPAAADTWDVSFITYVGNTFSNSSLALDANGNPRVSYYDGTHSTFKYASWNGTGWDTQTVDPTTDAGYGCSMVLDSSGNPHISYCYGSTIRYASWNGTAWDIQSINEDPTVRGASSTSLGLDSSGYARISYSRMNADFTMTPRCASWNGASWDVQTVDPSPDVGWYTSLAVDATGKPRISYLDNINNHLKYASWNGSSWDIETVGPGGSCNSLALDANGNPRVSYYDGSSYNLKYSSWNGASWDTTTVDNADSGWGSSLKLDPSGNPRISYQALSGTYWGIKYASWNGTTWDYCFADWQSDHGVGGNTSLALNAYGFPYITYFDITFDYYLKLAYLEPAPEVRTVRASYISPTAATLNGEITTTQGYTADRRGFRYKAQGATSWTDWHEDGSFAAGAFSKMITGLRPQTTYLFQAYARSAGGTSYGEDATFSPPMPTHYLAEGTNAWGFSTYITLENPNASACRAKLTYMDPNPSASGKGILRSRTIALPALSQTTVSSMADIGEVDFSTMVESPDGKALAVDRTMFWNGVGETMGYHSSIGTSAPSKTWYLPEGSSAWGFETWTAILNPNPTAADLTLTYMTQAGPIAISKTVPANSRATYSMASDIGVADASIQVASNQPVVAERSMYNQGRREGSCSIGATTPAKDYYLAEGAVGYDVGFTTWVLVQNPNNSPNDVKLTYQTQGGPALGPHFTMAPNSRKTINIGEGMPPNEDVSTVVTGTKPLVAERAMYWDNGTGPAFHASIGLASPHMTFMCPDGQTSNGFETWTLVENPNPGFVTVRLSYLPAGGGKTISFTDEIPAASRRSYSLADKIPSGRAAIMVESLDGARPVIVERSMYMDNRGAGTDTIGGYSD
jgi:hypothetical protein